ncbi:ATP-dependent helicase, partial [bacterium]|nr:ATP-dependent helicase [bacterium]
NLISKSENLNTFIKNLGNLKINSKGKENLNKLIKTLKEIERLEIPEAIDIILNSGYKKYLTKKYKDDAERLEDIESLKEISLSYSSLSDFLSEASLQEHVKGEKTSSCQTVILSTIHQAKGLEWKIVFIIGVSDGHFPHPSSMYDIMALEEERRIFYVAVTRAKEDLYITYYTRDFYRYFSSEKSIFIEEILPSYYEEWNFE